MRTARRPFLAGTLIVAAACGKGGVGLSPKQGQDNDSKLAVSSEDQRPEEATAAELAAALSAAPEAERMAAWRALSEAQRHAVLDYLRKRSSLDASVAGMVDGQPFPAAWLVPDEQPAPLELPGSSAPEERR